MNHPHYKKASANLRKVARLEARLAVIEEQIAELCAEQFLFEEEPFGLALRDFQAELATAKG